MTSIEQSILQKNKVKEKKENRNETKKKPHTLKYVSGQMTYRNEYPVFLFFFLYSRFNGIWLLVKIK
jgi:hypothetical protein